MKRWWVRRHTNNWQALVFRLPDREVYLAMASSRDPDSRGGGQPFEHTLEEAQVYADKAAHHDCDGKCPGWQVLD